MQDLVRVLSFLIILGLLRSVVTFDIPLLLNETHVIMTRSRTIENVHPSKVLLQLRAAASGVVRENLPQLRAAGFIVPRC